MSQQLKLVEDGPVIEHFSYAVLDRDVEVSARTDAEIIRTRMRRTAEDIVEIGQALSRQKKALPHGLFLPWIRDEFGMSPDTAQRFIRVAEMMDGKYRNLRHLPPSVLYELSSPSTPEPIREEADRRAAVGDQMKDGEVKRLKAEAKREKERADRLAREKEDVENTAFAKAVEQANANAEARTKQLEAQIKDLRDEISIKENLASTALDREGEATERLKELEAELEKLRKGGKAPAPKGPSAGLAAIRKLWSVLESEEKTRFRDEIMRERW